MEDFLVNELKWVKRGQILFKESTNQKDFSYFGWGDTELQLYGYVNGYKDGADELVEIAVTSQDISILDTYIFPICFMYRHSLELMLKSLFLKYSWKSKEEKKETIKRVSHNLSEIWKEVRLVIEKYSLKHELDDIEIAEDYIMQFDLFDKDSFSFRYPITKRLQLIHDKWQYLDIVNLKNRMEEIHNFLEGVDLATSERTSAEYESMQFLSGIDN